MMSSWKETIHWWNGVWFTPKSPELLSKVRLACGLVATVHFVILLINGFEWFGPQGWFNTDAGRYLIGDGVEGTGSFYRWSILYRFPQAIPFVAGVGLLASTATMVGIGARISPFLAWFCLSTFHHRSPLLTMVYEPLLVSILAYLIIDPGRLVWTIRPGFSSGRARISVNFATQLIYCHLWIWIAFSLFSMLANPIWWNGEAGWLLIQQERGWGNLSTDWQWLGQLLTHCIIATQASVLFCMMQPTCNWLGRWMLYLFALSVLLLLGDWMYASVLLVASLAVWPVHLSRLIIITKQE